MKVMLILILSGAPGTIPQGLVKGTEKAGNLCNFMLIALICGPNY